MTARRQYSGLCTALAAAVFGAILPAAALTQTIADPNSRAPQPETVTSGQPLRPSTATRDLSLPSQEAESQAASDIIPKGDPSEDAEEMDDNLDPRPKPGQRAVVQDGDLSYPSEPGVVYDGLVPVGEPPMTDDGVDPTAIDTRDKDEIDLFENPPAGYDPLLFQIEDIDPISTDRRPARLARFEPYDPVGIRIGSFVYFPEMELSGVSTNNVLSSPEPASDVYASISSVSRLVSNWQTHALELRSTGLYTFHDEFPSEDDRAWGLEARGRIDITKRTNAQGLVSHDVRQEGRSAIDASSAGERPDVTTDEAAASLNHRFNRLSLRLRGTHTELDYDNTGTGPSLVVNDDRDSTTDRGALRATWEFKPTFSGFAEAEIDRREFGARAQSDGIWRNSDGERYRFGVDFGSTGQILRGEASLGWGRQTPDDGRLEAVDAMLIDANLAWRVSEMTSLLVNAQTDIYDTTSAGSAGVVSHTAGAELRHAFRTYLIGTAGVSVSSRDYASDPLEETDLRAYLGAEYFLNREFVLFGRYQHTAFSSNAPDSDYDVDDVRLGVRWRR